MTARPISLILAAGLLILIGTSGMAVGGGLLGSVVNGTATAPDTRAAGITIGSAIAAYGFAAVLAGVALLIFRRWAWRLALLLIVLGLVGLGGALLAVGPDAVLASGLVIWAVTLVCLVAPDTRRAVAG